MIHFRGLKLIKFNWGSYAVRNQYSYFINQLLQLFEYSILLTLWCRIIKIRVERRTIVNPFLFQKKPVHKVSFQVIRVHMRKTKPMSWTFGTIRTRREGFLWVKRAKKKKRKKLTLCKDKEIYTPTMKTYLTTSQ